MYGLLSSMYNNYRINNATVDREKFRNGKAAIKNALSWPARGVIMFLEIALTVIALLALYDTYRVKNWDTWLLILVLILFFIPCIGDLVAIFIIAYWFVIIRPESRFL